MLLCHSRSIQNQATYKIKILYLFKRYNKLQHDFSFAVLYLAFVKEKEKKSPDFPPGMSTFPGFFLLLSFLTRAPQPHV